MSGATLTLYCQGIGDCNLIEFDRGAGQPPYRVLIDCGMHSSTTDGPAKLHAVVADLARRCTPAAGGKPHLDVIVGTHEHWDHLSGFWTERDLFKTFDVGEIWLAWTEDPNDPAARQMDHYKGFAAPLDAITRQLQTVAPGSPLAAGMAALAGFRMGPAPGGDAALMGLAGDSIRQARDALTGLVPAGKVRYFKPGAAIAVPAAQAGVTAYVLGPPTDPALIKRLEITGQMYALDVGEPSLEALANALTVQADADALDDDPTAPFDATEGMALSDLAGPAAAHVPFAGFFANHYFGPVPDISRPPKQRITRAGKPVREAVDTDDQQWRRIDADWMGPAAQMAMQLDSQTNNTSLVLAFELGQGGEVMLFAADAQIGNWISWPKVQFDSGPTGLDLLHRTSFYKVGHHGSANATQVGTADYPGGLESMDADKLRAFIPTDKKSAAKVKWGAIPAPKLLTRLVEMTGGKVKPAGDGSNDLLPAAPSRVIRGDQVDLYVDKDHLPDWVAELGPPVPGLLDRLYVTLRIGA